MVALLTAVAVAVFQVSVTLVLGMGLAVALSTAQRSMAKVCNLHNYACTVRRFLTMHFDLYFYDGSCALKMSKKDVSYLLNLKKGCRLLETEEFKCSNNWKSKESESHTPKESDFCKELYAMLNLMDNYPSPMHRYTWGGWCTVSKRRRALRGKVFLLEW